MNQEQMQTVSRTLEVSYDGSQHCTAVLEPQGKIVATDCPYTGKGEEFSPMNLVGTGLAGCMLISMGTLAMRDQLDISGARVHVELVGSEKRIETIDLTFTMPRNFSEVERTKLQRAAESCPIEHSFHPDIPITIRYDYPEQ
jgi:putative redox protein